MMQGQAPSCDLCLGSDLGPYRGAAVCGRELLRCAQCGLVMARGAAGAPGAPSMARPERDAKADLRRAAAVTKLLPSGRVLDLGCGPGYFLAGLDPSRYQAVGLEVDHGAARRAASRIEEAGLRGGVVEGWLPRDDLGVESFDLVALFGVLDRTGSPRATLMEVARLLRAGGYALIETPSLSSMTARILGPRWRPLRDPASTFIFTAASLERMALQCGFLPGAARLAVPAGWPSPGTLVYAARKSAESARRPGLASLSGQVVSKASPLGATQ